MPNTLELLKKSAQKWPSQTAFFYSAKYGENMSRDGIIGVLEKYLRSLLIHVGVHGSKNVIKWRDGKTSSYSRLLS